MKLKKCPKCNKVLPESMFTKSSNICRICRRDYDWLYRYNITPEYYLELYTKQEGKCKICESELTDDGYLCVDHNNKTGKIRGLLCNSCNKGLGCFRDNTEYLKRAKEYLENG